jgi:hypothetical protein
MTDVPGATGEIALTSVIFLVSVIETHHFRGTRYTAPPELVLYSSTG